MFNNRISLLLSATALTGFAISTSYAADQINEMYSAPYNWGGAYAGVSVAGHGSLAGFDLSDFWEDNGYAEDAEVARQGALGIGFGIYAGYNWQNLNRVFGLELNAEILDGNGETYFDVADSDDWGRFEMRQRWLASLRGRAGIAMDETLAYATAGLAAGSIESGIYAPDKYTKAIRSGTYYGHVVGFGVEHAVSDNISLRLEGTWTRLYTSGRQEDSNNDYGEITKFKNTDDLAVTVGVAYQFGDNGSTEGTHAMQPMRDWSGAYVGLAASGIASMASADAIDFWEDNGYDSRGAYLTQILALGGGAGGYAGYNFQGDNLVVGLETTFDWYAAESSSEFDVVDSSYMGEFINRTRWVGSVRARAGKVHENTLLYLTGGVAFGEVEAGIYAPGKYTKALTDGVYWGAVAGAGVEQAIQVSGRDVILRAEGTWTRLFTGGNESFPDNDYGDEMDFNDTDIMAFKVGAALPF